MAINTIKFSEMTAGGDLGTDNKTPGLLGGANVLFNNPWTFLAAGTTGERPIPSPSMYYRLRLNTTLEVYEYYDPTTVTWAQLSGSGTGTVNPGVANDIAFYAANGQAVSPIASAANAVLGSNGSGVPSMLTTLPTGLAIPSAAITASTAALLSGSVAAAPVSGTDLTNKIYVDSLFGSGVASATGTTNQVLVNGVAGVPTSGAITLSLPQDIAIGSTPTFAGLTLSAIPLGFSSGGTNRNSLPLLPAASSYSAWDSNVNFSANSFLAGFATQATAAGTTVLTVASAQTQEFTGATTQTVTLPVVSTLAVGREFYIINNSTGAVTVNSSGGNLVLTLAANTSGIFTSILNTGTTAASWNASYIVDAGGGVSPGTVNQLAWYSATGNTVSGLATANNGVLVTDAGGVPSISTTLPAGLTIPGYGAGFSSVVVQTFSASGTYTPTANMVYAIIEVVGGGGGGGGTTAAVATTTSSGAAGGSGGYSRSYVTAATVGASQTVTIGAGGTAGTSAGGSGGAGGNTSVGAICIANGGSGGNGSAVGFAGGAGGTAGTGDVTVVGNAGGPRFQTVSNSASGYPLPGAPSYFGGGALAPSSPSASGNAGTRGGGGSGGTSTNPSGAATGGAGGAGYIVITEFIS